MRTFRCVLVAGSIRIAAHRRTRRERSCTRLFSSRPATDRRSPSGCSPVKITSPTGSAFPRPGPRHRLGSLAIHRPYRRRSGRGDGQREVIALLHRQGSQIDGIGTAVEGIADTVDGIAVAQEAVSESIGVLTSLCAVNLGFSILTPAILLMQYTALCRRLDRLLRDMKGIESRLEA